MLKNEVLRGRVRAAPSGSRVPSWLRRIVRRGLEADPRRRFPSMTALLDTLERTQSARRRIPLAAAAFAGIALAGWGALADVVSPSGSRCDDASARLSGAWDDARRGAVASAFGKSDLPYAADAAQRVSRQLDDWATRWSAAHRAACLSGEAEGARGSAALDARMTCLRRRLAEVAALTEELSAADDAVIQLGHRGAGRAAAGDRLRRRVHLERALALAEVARAEVEGARGGEPLLARLAREISAKLSQWHANTD